LIIFYSFLINAKCTTLNYSLPALTFSPFAERLSSCRGDSVCIEGAQGIGILNFVKTIEEAAIPAAQHIIVSWSSSWTKQKPFPCPSANSSVPRATKITRTAALLCYRRRCQSVSIDRCGSVVVHAMDLFLFL
jgi:hypothetical protein